MISDRFKNDHLSLLTLNKLQKKIKGVIEKKVNKGIYSFESVPCVICSSNDFEPLAEKDRYGLYMPVVCCKKCGLIQTNPRMTEKSYHSFYKKEQKKLYTGKKGPDEDYFKKQYNRGKEIYFFLKKYNIQFSKVLEIGSSCGGILSFFKDNGCEIIGCDLNKTYVNYGRKKGLNLRNEKINNINLDWNPDLIILSHVIEHLLDPISDLTYISSICKGVLYIEVPGIMNLPFSYNRNLLEYLQNAHVYHFTLKSLTNILNKSGWEKIEGDEYIRAIFKPNNSKRFDFKKDYIEPMKLLRNLG